VSLEPGIGSLGGFGSSCGLSDSCMGSGSGGGGGRSIRFVPSRDASRSDLVGEWVWVGVGGHREYTRPAQHRDGDRSARRKGLRYRE
jgi:hypothetical protein